MKIQKLIVLISFIGFALVGNVKSQTVPPKSTPAPSGKTAHNPNIGMCNQAYDTLHYKQIENCGFTINDNPSLKIISFSASSNISGMVEEIQVKGNKISSSDFILNMRKGKATKIFLYKIGRA